MKFYKSKKADGVFVARKENGKVAYIYGTIENLIKANLLIPGFCDDQNGVIMDSYAHVTWAAIDREGNVTEFESKEELKGAICND